MYRSLRRLRIAVSAVFIIMLTLAVVDTTVTRTHVGEWLMSVQLVPAILAGSAIWIVVWVLVTISFGRVYCSTVCPMGTLQDAAARAGRRLSRGAGRRYRYSAPVDVLRFPIPVIVAVCLVAGVTTVVAATDPFHLYSGIVMAVARPLALGTAPVAVAMVVLAVVSAFAWRRGRLLCNTVCPVGGFLGLLARQAVYAVDINTDKCIHCGKCEDVCKAECINLKDCVVDNSRCVMCLDCTAVCPNDAITVRRGKHRLSIPMMMKTSGPTMNNNKA